jgi:hypothetical protein
MDNKKFIDCLSKPLTLSVVGCGGEGPTPLASQHSWRVSTENNYPLKATDKVGGNLLRFEILYFHQDFRFVEVRINRMNQNNDDVL